MLPSLIVADTKITMLLLPHDVVTWYIYNNDHDKQSGALSQREFREL